MAVRLGDPVEKSHGRQDINDRYHRYDKVLGRGAYKTVYWGWDTSEGVDVAWNCIDLDALPTTEERSKILREVEMLQNLHHKHILRIRDHWENPQTNQLCFITDIVQGGSLREYIRQREVNLLRVKSWCLQILDALQYLHGSSPVIIHRDLKCDNIFIDGPTGNITIGDLGLSTKYASNSLLTNKDKGMSIVGTPEFMAPELYEEQYDEKVDIYSFGMCVLEMVSGKYPYEECTNQIQVIRKVTEKKQPDILRRLHRYVRTFIEICIERDPRKRPAAHELLHHPFLCFLDDLKNKWSVSDFVFDEDCTIKHYKEQMENKSKHRHHQQQLSIIKETSNSAICLTDRGGSNSKSPSPKSNKHTSNAIKRSKKGRTKKKYVTGTTVSVEEGGNISVKLKIHHDKESQKVKFQYAPHTENIQSVVREMVETLELDRSREGEIVASIKMKLKDLEGMKKESMPPPPRAATQPPQTQAQTQYSDAASVKSHTPTPPTQAPIVFPKVFNANGTAAQRLHPNTIAHTNTTQHAMPVTALLSMNNATNNTNKTRRMSSNIAHKSHLNIGNKQTKANTTQSAPVTPGHSPETEKHFVSKFKAQTGYTSDTVSDFVGGGQDKNGPKIVSDSLLDQIMALPRETIKARIVQFGGAFVDEESTAVLVTKLFQLLSDNTPTNSGKINKSQHNETTATTAVAPPTETAEDEATPALIMQHTMNIQHIGSNPNAQAAQHLSNLQMKYHGASTSESVHCSPPNIMNPLPRIHNTMQQVIETPPNELVFPQLTNAQSVPVRTHLQQQQQQQISHAESPTSTVHVISPKPIVHQRSQSYTNHPLPIGGNGGTEEEEDGPEELDPNIQLPKLRLRQKELMKGKIVHEMKRLKQRNCTTLGRDKTMDTIAAELAEVEKQIKVLTDAFKTGNKTKHKKHNKTMSDSNVLSTLNTKDDKDKRKVNLNLNTECVHTHSRRNSIESIDVSMKRNDANISVMESANHSAHTSQSVSLLVDPVSSPLVSNTHRSEFECHLQRLSSALDLSEIAFNLDELFGLNAENAVSYEVFQNAKDRIARENAQLEEEYKQYYDDQTEMLLLKLQKHQNNHNKCVSETQSTQNKLLSKQDKQRNKFKSIVNDQLQILQLTQELNDDTQNNIQPQPLPLPQDEFYLYREEMDKAYLERVKQFETKQKKELDSFRKDLGELKQLRLEVRKKNLSKMMTSNPSSPLRSPRPQLQFEDRSFTLSNNAPKHVNRASHSSAPHTQQIDILTGLDLKLINDANDMKPQAPLIQSNVNDAASTAMRHYHSSSLPLGIEHQHPKTHNTLNTIATTPHATCAPQSKFKVSHVNNAQIHKQAMHAMHTTQHT
eukprot:534966_1